jgi:hypothetical protein
LEYPVFLESVVAVIREVDFNRAELIYVSINVEGSQFEGVLALAIVFLDGLGGGAVHVLHVEQVSIELDIQDDNSTADERVNIEAVDEENCIMYIFTEKGDNYEEDAEEHEQLIAP